MRKATPPPLPQRRGPALDQRSKCLIGLALIPTIFIGAVVILRICGLVQPFSVPTGSMTPAISAGDHVIMEDITFLMRKPRRGDIVVFKTDGIASLPPNQIYNKRIAGEPGDHLQISGGQLFINDQLVTLSNAVGRITYFPPALGNIFAPLTNLTVPGDCYFVLGDNSTNSSDSRYWGGLPRGNITGRVWFCYWPLQRVGFVK